MAKLVLRGSSGGSRNLILGQLLGQLALFSAIPFLTREIPPVEMGLYQIGFSVALVLQPLATLRREMLIPFATIQLARRQRTVGLISAGSLASFVFIVAILAWSVGYVHLAVGAASTAFILAAQALMYLENAFLIRCGANDRLAIRNLTGGVLCAGLQVFAAFATASAVAIAAAYFMGRVVVSVATAARMPSNQVEVDRSGPKKERTPSTILSAMVAASSSQAIVIGSVLALGAAGGAQVAIAQRIASTPVALVSQALMQVSLSAAAPLIREGRSGLKSQLWKQTLRTSMFAAPLALALMIGGPLLAVPILGPQWQQAGILIAILAIPLSLMLVALPSSTLLIPLGRARTLLSLQALRLAFILTALMISASLFDDIVLVCLWTSIVWVLAYVPLIIVGFRASLQHDRTCSSSN